MNYLREINAFIDWLETNPLDATTQTLWFHLMAIANKCGWPEWFAVANLTLQAKVGVDKKTLIKHRNYLIQKGLIKYKNQGKKAGKYNLIPISEQIRGNIPPKEKPTESISGNLPPEQEPEESMSGNNPPNREPKWEPIREPNREPNCPPLNKLNETKLNKTLESNDTPDPSDVTDPSKKKDILSAVPYDEIISYLNSVCGTSYKSSSKATRAHINARWREGFRLEDFKRVIDKKAAEWLHDPKMAKYLRPETLFGTKFESYLNAPEVKSVDKPKTDERKKQLLRSLYLS